MEKALESLKGQINWIELVTHFRCNCSCRVCPTARLNSSAALTLEDISRCLQAGKDLGASGVWFGGGEPTLYEGLLYGLRTAKTLGYENLLVQTNGMRFAYRAYADRLVDAGMNLVNLSFKGASPRVHDHISRVHGSFALLKKASRNLVARGVKVGVDILVTSSSVHQLEELVDVASDIGVSSIVVMLLSLHGLDRRADARWLPDPGLLRENLDSAMDRAQNAGLEITSLQIPPCLLSKRHRKKYFHAGKYKLLVVPPGQEPFMSETSPTEGGAYLKRCANCSLRQDCLGFTKEYLATMKEKLEKESSL